MYATYRLRANEITDKFIKTLKDSFKDREIEITVTELNDETEYLLKSEANRKQLLESIEKVKSEKPIYQMTIEEVENLGRWP